MQVVPILPQQFVFADFLPQSWSVPTAKYDNPVEFEEQEVQESPFRDGALIVGYSYGRSDNLESVSSRCFNLGSPKWKMGYPLMPLTTNVQPDAISFHHP